MANTAFNIRNADASKNDADFIVAAFDSTLLHLAATGNGGQWGSQPFSEKEGFRQTTVDDVNSSEKFRLTGNGERIRIFIAEVQDEASTARPAHGLCRRRDETGAEFLAVGAVVIRDDEFASHTHSFDVLKPIVAEAETAGGFVFVDVLISDYRVETRRQGAGRALINEVKKYAQQQGKENIYVDCWTGGTGKLVGYYEHLGFTALKDFEFLRKDGSVWPGRFFRLNL